MEMQTDVYQSVPRSPTDEERYERNEQARRAILGPLSWILKCSGFDETYSLFKKETRCRLFSFIATPVAVGGLLFIFIHMFGHIHNIKDVLTWHWGEMFVITFLSVFAFGSALGLTLWTRSLFFLDFYNGWLDCVKQSEKKTTDMSNGNNGETAVFIGQVQNAPTWPKSRTVLCILSFIAYGGVALITDIKYAQHRGHVMVVNESWIDWRLDELCQGEPIIHFWFGIVCALGLSIYGTLHSIVIEQVEELNKDLKESSDVNTLKERLDDFGNRQQAVLSLTRTLSKHMGAYATLCVKGGVVSHAMSMFLSLAFKGEISLLSNLCVVFWTIVSIAILVVVLIQPANLQKRHNRTTEILMNDKQIWNGDLLTVQKTQSMVQRHQYSNTTVTIYKCLKLTPWVANAIMVIPPITGGIMIALRAFLM